MSTIKRLPNSKDWVYRREVISASSGRVYIIAKNRNSGIWGCSCPGWINHRRCKHLRALGKLELQCEVV